MPMIYKYLGFRLFFHPNEHNLAKSASTNNFINFIKVFLFVYLLSACSPPTDPIVAKAFHQNLYLSEVLKQIPSGLANSDSVMYIDLYINQWLEDQVLTAAAKKELSVNEQNFENEIIVYKNKLLVNKYLQKNASLLTNENINENELEEFMQIYYPSVPIYKEMVKVNYLKLSKNSIIYKQSKELLFNEKNRNSAKLQLKQLCADSIEYFLENDQWVYLEFIENEFPFEIKNKENLLLHSKLDILHENYRYLILFVDTMQKLQIEKSEYEKQSSKYMLLQKRQLEFVQKLRDSLFQKAVSEKRIMKYKPSK